jgi:hypothetical protein
LILDLHPTSPNRGWIIRRIPGCRVESPKGMEGAFKQRLRTRGAGIEGAQSGDKGAGWVTGLERGCEVEFSRRWGMRRQRWRLGALSGLALIPGGVLGHRCQFVILGWGWGWRGGSPKHMEPESNGAESQGC